MFGQDRHAAEELEERRENLRRDHPHREVIHFGHREVLAADAEQVVGGLVELGVVHDVVPGEDDIVGRERFAVAPAHALAQFEGPRLLVRRDRPGLGQAGAGLLRGPIQIDQRGKEQADDGIGGAIESNEGIEGLGTGAGGDDKTPARLAGVAFGDERGRAGADGRRWAWKRLVCRTRRAPTRMRATRSEKRRAQSS